MEKAQECLICGKPLIYTDEARRMTCFICGKRCMSNACCEDGHYICDECHSEKNILTILEVCTKTESKNPIEIMNEIMHKDGYYMHGPEHHVMVGAAMLAAYKNCGGELNFPVALREMAVRGKQVPGGTCGLWGACGAAISTGIFVSIVTRASPLSQESWGLCNEMTSRSLAPMAKTGGPRCCKRNSYLAAIEAASFCSEKLGVTLEMPEKIQCEFTAMNNQCIGRRCPFIRRAPDSTAQSA
ncbi:MAG: SAM-dependent methyltransferase [Oscillospiraceae bacterium]|nr:SAM-dependent methyltransferase [Oscillospiraceae bacterium]